MSKQNYSDEDFDWSSVKTSGKTLPEIFLVRHHLAHASNSIFQSNFEDGDFLTLDFMGERETGMYGMFNLNNIEKLHISKQPRSTGAFYASMTEMLGYQYDSDEWKIMALSANKKISNKAKKYIEIFKEVTLSGGISPLLKNEFFNTDQPREKYLTTEKLRKMLDAPEIIEDRNSDSYRQWQMDIASAMQKFISEYTFNSIKIMAEKYHSKKKNICLSGGFFMICVFNGELERSKLYENIFISQSPADLGNSIGSALYVEHIINKGKRLIKKQKLFTGKKAELNIDKKLSQYQIKFEKFINEDKLVKKITDYLLDNKIIALYNNRSEFGERALGARSIISFANKSEMKDLINGIPPSRDNLDDDVDTPKTTAPSVPKTGGSATAPAN